MSHVQSFVERPISVAPPSQYPLRKKTPFDIRPETKVKAGRKKVTSSPGVNLVYAVAYFVVSAEHVLRVILLSYNRVDYLSCGISALDRFISRMFFFLRGIV